MPFAAVDTLPNALSELIWAQKEKLLIIPDWFGLLENALDLAYPHAPVTAQKFKNTAKQDPGPDFGLVSNVGSSLAFC